MMLTKSKSRTEKAAPDEGTHEESESDHEPIMRPERKELLKHAWFDRDLGWLAFNNRVLHEALDDRNPLLERLKFLAIVHLQPGRVLHEAGERSAREGARRGSRRSRPPRGMTRASVPNSQEVIGNALGRRRVATPESLLPRSPERYRPGNLGRPDDCPARGSLASFRHQRLARPHPARLRSGPSVSFMSNLSTNWAFVLRDEVPRRCAGPGQDTDGVTPWVDPFSRRGARRAVFLGLEDLIRHNAYKLFPGMEIVDATPFRILRNAQVELEDDEGDSLRDAVTDALRQRRFEPVVRVDFTPGGNTRAAGTDGTFRPLGGRCIRLRGCSTTRISSRSQGSTCRNSAIPSWTPRLPLRLSDSDVPVVDAVDAGSILVHHPYESFDASVERFIDEAADDPKTLAIKMTVYRVGDDTPFVRSLIRAAEAGKQVACVIELTARFDEARNLHWAQELEKVGAHVTLRRARSQDPHQGRAGGTEARC